MPPRRKPQNKNEWAAFKREVYGKSNLLPSVEPKKPKPSGSVLPYQNIGASFKRSKNLGDALKRAKQAGFTLSPYTNEDDFSVEELDNATRALMALPPSLREAVKNGDFKLTIGREHPYLTTGSNNKWAIGVAGYERRAAYAQSSANYSEHKPPPIGGGHRSKRNASSIRLVYNSPDGFEPVILHELGHLMDDNATPVTGSRRLDASLAVGRALVRGLQAVSSEGASFVPMASSAEDFKLALKNQDNDKWMSDYIKKYGAVEAYAEAFAYYHASNKTRNLLPESIRLYFDKHYGSKWQPRSHGLTGRAYAK